MDIRKKDTRVKTYMIPRLPINFKRFDSIMTMHLKELLKDTSQ